MHYLAICFSNFLADLMSSANIVSLFGIVLLKAFLYLLLPLLIFPVQLSFEKRLSCFASGKKAYLRFRARNIINLFQDAIKIFRKEPISYSSTTNVKLIICPAIILSPFYHSFSVYSDM